MLRRRPTYEELIKETMTHRLKILPERQRRTQQGMLIEDVDFDDFDLSRYNSKEILLNNPEKGTQTDLFQSRSSTEKSESVRREEEPAQSYETKSEPTQEREPKEPVDAKAERHRGKSMMRRIYDAMFGEDEFREEREELRNRREQIEEEPEIDASAEEQVEEEEDEEDEDDLPMNVKKIL